MTNSLAERFFDFDLWLVGAAHFVILFASFQVPYRLRWKQDLALGTEWIHSADHRCLWRADFGAAYGTAPWRPRCFGTRLLYRDLLDGANPCGRSLLLPHGLAKMNGVHRGTCPPDGHLFRGLFAWHVLLKSD